MQARLIRVAALVAPIAASIAFVALVSKVFPAPLESFWLYLAWWVVLTGAATLVLIAVDRVARRLLPLAVLLKLSLVFPDHAPSRFRTALSSRSVGTLEERVAAAKAGQAGATPVEAAQELLALVAALDTHDPLTRGHSDRVRAYAQMIAEEMHLSSEEVDLLNWAALLHDIGKLDVPTEILAKKGRPTDDEWAILRRHPEFGGEIVKPLRSWLGDWTDAVTQHHERWDGKGYPLGTSGGQIALAGRIVAIADVFDVITSARSYKDASDALAGREEIARCAGAEFDPKVVRAFLGISLGRLRFAMGPLSWLSHAPLLGRLPLTPAIGTVSGALAVATAALTTGIVAPPPPEPALAATQVGLARNMAVAVDEDTSVVLRVPGIRTERNVTVRVVRSASAGSATVTSDGRLRYVPPRDFDGAVSFAYEVCDAEGRCTTATARIVVRPVNDDPVARDDVLTVAEDAPVSIVVLANDSDADGDPLAVSAVTDVSAGSATVGGGRVRLRLPDGFNGKATFTYTVRDGNGGYARATGTVFAQPRNDPPRAAPDTARTAVAVPVRVRVLDNDTDPDGDPIWVLRASAASPGVTSNDGTAVTYTPPPGFQGVAHFTYTISDPKYAVASTRVEVAVGDANLAPRAVDDEGRVEAGGSVSVDVLANDSDPDGDTLRLASVGAPETGTVRIEGGRVRYTAPVAVHGVVAFSYTAADPSGATGRATVHVTVAEVVQPEQPSPTPPPPAVGNGGPSPSTPLKPAPDASPVPAPEPPAAVPPSAPPLPPPPPSIPNTAPSFTAGADKAVLEDAGTITVAGWATAISQGPPADAAQTVSFTTSNSNVALFTIGGQPAVAPDGTLTFTPAPNANGNAVVTVTAVDNGGTAGGGADTSAPKTFTIVVTPVNDAPVFTAGANPVVVEDAGPQSIGGWATAIAAGPADESSQSVTFTVMNSNTLLFTAGGQPAVAADGTLTFTTAPNAFGSAVVSGQAVDGGGTANGGADTSTAQTFTIQVTGQTDPPAAVDDAVSVNEDGAGVTFDVLANDSDPDGDPVTLGSFDGSTIADGMLTDNGGGSFTYVPDSAFFGSETFTYTAADGTGGVDSGTVTITVAPQPDDPVAGADAYTTAQATVLTVPAPGLLGNDYDEDGDGLTVATSVVVAPANGLALLLADGSFVYTPNPFFVGTDTFTYRIDDGTGRTADGLVTITVDSTVSSATLYLQSTGPSADVWDISAAVPPAATPVPDYDSDSDQGLTIKSSDGDESEPDTRKYQIWRYVVGAPLQLNGPVMLQLWSTSKQFKTDKDGHPYLYLYDCAVGGTACIKIAETDEHVDDWNGSTANWVYHEITIGSVNRAIAAGRELRIRLLMQHEDFWLPLTAAYPSALAITTG